MNRLFYLICILISYGSLFPFHIHAAPTEAWEALLSTWNHSSSRGDLLGNIFLFVPLGLVGIWTYGRKPWLLAAAFALALGLQILQIYIPSRDPSLQDVLWNMVGTVMGTTIAWGLPLRRLSMSSLHVEKNLHFVFVLLGAWLCYRLMPFIPSLDVQEIKNSLKPLLLHPHYDNLGLFHDTIAWASFACLLFTVTQETKTLSAQRSLLLLISLSAATLAAEVIIVSNALSLTNLLGACLGVGLWWFWLRRLSSATTILALLLALMLLLKGLAPFSRLYEPAEFHWLPFYGFLGGSMLINIAVVFEKFFLYGSLLWLLQQEGASQRFALITTLILTTAIEMGQVFFAGHTPEITEPLLVLLIAYTQHGLSPRQQTQANPVSETAVARRAKTRHTIGLF